MKNSKQFEKVFVVLLAAKGNEVTKAELETLLGATVELYRISTYIWNIKKKLGGDVKVVKTGKQVTGYILVNFEKFKNYNATQAAAAAAKVVPVSVPKMAVTAQARPKVRTAKAAMSRNEARAAAPVEAPPVVKIGEVPSYTVDGEFDSFDINDVVGAL